MKIEQLNDKLIFRIRLEMDTCRALINLSMFRDFSIHELNFLIDLLEIIDTKESNSTATYIKCIIKKAKLRD